MTVERMSGLDAAFLALENARNRLHVMSVMVVDPATVTGGLGAEGFMAALGERLPQLRPLRCRMRRAPLGLGRPVWQDGGAPDLDRHLRRVRLDPPGDQATLARLAAEIADVPLDRGLPLWELVVVDGLDDGRLAVIAKLHHSLMDGAAGMEFMGALFTLTPEAEPVLPPAPTAAVDRGSCTVLAQTAATAKGAARAPVTAARVTGAMGSAALRIGRSMYRGGFVMPLGAPRTPLDGAGTGHRVIAMATLRRSEVEAVRAATGATVNDVVLAAVAGSLRTWLEEHGGAPERSLVAAMPVSVHGEVQAGAGNELAVGLVALPTELPDPIDRLAAVRESAAAAKRLVGDLGAGTLMALMEAMAPSVISAASSLYAAARLADRHPPVCNLLVSNVSGPPVPLYLAGARLVALYPLGPVYDGLGCNVTVISREDELDVGVVAWRERAPDLEQLARGIGGALRELRSAIVVPRGRSAGPAARAAGTGS